MKAEPDNGSREVLLRYFARLADELVSQQSMRARMDIFKLSALGLLFFAVAVSRTGTERAGVAKLALALAPIIAVFLDAHIQGMSRTIKQIGHYIRTHIEPLLMEEARIVKDVGVTGRCFLPYELWLAIYPPRGRWMPTMVRGMVPTYLTAVASAVALAPVACAPWEPIVAPEVAMEPWLFLVWAAVTVLLLLVDRVSFAVPSAWTRPEGKSGETVLVDGRYIGECLDCSERPGIKVLARGTTFDGHTQVDHVVRWRYATEEPRRLSLRRWIARAWVRLRRRFGCGH